MTVLGRERAALRTLLFRVLEVRSQFTPLTGVLAAAAEAKAADAEREAVISGMRCGEEDRRETLQVLADRAPEPFASLLGEHRTELRRLSADVAGAVADLAAHDSTLSEALEGLPLPALRSFLR